MPLLIVIFLIPAAIVFFILKKREQTSHEKISDLEIEIKTKDSDLERYQAIIDLEIEIKRLNEKIEDLSEKETEYAQVVKELNEKKRIID